MNNEPDPPTDRRLPLLGVLAFLTLILAIPTRVPGEPAPTPPPVVQPKSWPEPVRGQVRDADRQAPIPGATIHAGLLMARSDGQGLFAIGPVAPSETLLVKAPGYERKAVIANSAPLTVRLKPHSVRAAYLTYYGVGDRGIRSRVFELLNRTELNAVVIDVKGDRGLIPYRTQVPLALEVGAQGPVIVKEFEQMIAGLKARGVYTIARIVVFKDNVLAQARPEWAIIDTRTGKPWSDNEKLAWVDPFREEVWQYAIAVAEEAARKGFDEIQFDYVRFPTDGKTAAARYARPNTKETRLEAISSFLARARRELAPTGAFLAADIFGYTAFNENDTDIGQRVEELAPHLDYLSPMVYPSGYRRGIPGYRNPVAHPYEVVFESVKLIRKRSANTAVRVRPWIQDFRDYAFDRRPFGVKEVRAQQKAAEDAGATGWMLWNPRNDYTAEALRPKATASVTSEDPK
jgi:hypothetical protein